MFISSLALLAILLSLHYASEGVFAVISLLALLAIIFQHNLPADNQYVRSLLISPLALLVLNTFSAFLFTWSQLAY